MAYLCRDILAYVIKNHCTLLTVRSFLWVSSACRREAVARFYADLGSLYRYPAPIIVMENRSHRSGKFDWYFYVTCGLAVEGKRNFFWSYSDKGNFMDAWSFYRSEVATLYTEYRICSESSFWNKVPVYLVPNEKVFFKLVGRAPNVEEKSVFEMRAALIADKRAVFTKFRLNYVNWIDNPRFIE